MSVEVIDRKADGFSLRPVVLSFVDTDNQHDIYTKGHQNLDSSLAFTHSEAVFVGFFVLKGRDWHLCPFSEAISLSNGQ